jgi:hypothetical protein
VFWLFGAHLVSFPSCAHNPAGGWLIELFADESTLTFAALGPALRAAVAVALSGPASPPR